MGYASFSRSDKNLCSLDENKTIDLKLYKKLKDLNERQVLMHSTIKDKEKFKKEAQEVKGMQIFGGGGDDKTHKFKIYF